MLTGLWSLLIGSHCGLMSQPESVDEKNVYGIIVLDSISVIGSREGAYDMPGSGQYLDASDLKRLQNDDINSALRSVPGVYLRGEDGYGLFPNISLRGVDTSRSAKLTLSEDGVLSAPAPYSAPSAYYVPTLGRMNAVEVLKGSSQIQYGPHTTGGVINYRSTPIPENDQSYIKMYFGSDNELSLHAWTGRNIQTESGRIGFLLEIFDRQTDGFKTIDRVDISDDLNHTGFHRSDYTAKFSWQPNWSKPNQFEFKLGYTDLDADETYLGISSEDFRKNPLRRYATSRFDNIKSNHTRIYLRHQVELSSSLKLTNIVYYGKFHRNWFKLNNINNPTTELSSALFNQHTSYNILTGQAAGNLRVRANNRDYYMAGWQTDGESYFSAGKTDHLINFGVRIHKDRIRRHQWHELFEQDGGGAIIGTTRSPDGSDGNRRQQTEAYAFYIKDEISRGAWTFIPGIRYEYLDLQYTDFTNDGLNIPIITEKGSMDLLAIGLGVTYSPSNNQKFFTGYHRGFSTPGPRAQLREGIGEETVDSFEAGLRLIGEDDFYTEIVLFLSKFNDLIVVDNIGGTGSGITENAGEVISKGLEISIRADLGKKMEWPFGMPLTVALTYTDSTLSGDGSTTDANSLFAGGMDGNRTPYIPEFQASLTTGFVFDRFSCFLQTYYTDATFTSASNASVEINPLTGQADARFGRTDRHAIVNLSFFYKVHDKLEIFAKIDNLLDRRYIASRHPHGPRPGTPRLAGIGLIMNF